VSNAESIGPRERLAVELATEIDLFLGAHPSLLDQKIMTQTVREMREAFALFAPFASTPKVTIFGSARVAEHDPLYEQTVAVSRELAAHGWMIVTGAGPGIMEAGMIGAGRANSIGVSIRLPHENEPNAVIKEDEKHVAMKYFFTRKLMLVKAAQGVICLPGGFGTLDELFELLTLLQTGKGDPVPLVLLDVPGDRYWRQVSQFIDDQMVTRGLVSPADTALYKITNDAAEAVHEIRSFYSNYRSMRYVGRWLYLRLAHDPTAEELEILNREFGHLVVQGTIEASSPHAAEVRDEDDVHLPRIRFVFGKHAFGDLRLLINRLNSFHPL
jgi:uncharacterized protein (TIGR00730 family)